MCAVASVESKIFNLSKFKLEDSFSLNVKDPDGNETGWFVELAGPAHALTLAAEEKNLREQMAEQEKWQEEATVAIKEGKDPPKRWKTVADFRNAKALEVSRRIISSDPFEFEGQEISLNAENSYAILVNPQYFDWLTAQLVNALGNKSNFTKRSA